MSSEREPQVDLEAEARRRGRHQALAIGAMALPNLFFRSFLTLALLYGALGAVLIALVQLGFLPNATIAVLIGCAVIALQYLLGPWFMDLIHARRAECVRGGFAPSKRSRHPEM